jgi:hypothetical protein
VSQPEWYRGNIRYRGREQHAWTRKLTLSAGYTLAGTPDPGLPPLPDKDRMSLDGRWP